LVLTLFVIPAVYSYLSRKSTQTENSVLKLQSKKVAIEV